MPTDIKIKKNETGFFDFKIVDGDFEIEEGLDTAILVSLFFDKRADESEVPDALFRRGWIGNLNNDDPSFKIGSKLWLLKKSRINQDTINKAITFTEDALQWLITEGIAVKLTVTAANAGSQLFIFITLLRPNGDTNKFTIKLWDNTDLDFGITPIVDSEINLGNQSVFGFIDGTLLQLGDGSIVLLN